MVAHERLTGPRVTIDLLLAKLRSFSNIPAFFYLNCSKTVIPSPVKLPYLAETIDISTASKIILFILKYLYVKKVKIHSL